MVTGLDPSLAKGGGRKVPAACPPRQRITGRKRIGGIDRARHVPEDRDAHIKLELIPVPVSHVDRAKTSYVDQVGFHADHDHRVSEGPRFIQLTPPGPACSIVIGEGITEMPPGSPQRDFRFVVRDVGGIRDALATNGVDASEIDVQPWGSFVSIRDPDGNSWSLQQVPERSWRTRTARTPHWAATIEAAAPGGRIGDPPMPVPHSQGQAAGLGSAPMSPGPGHGGHRRSVVVIDRYRPVPHLTADRDVGPVAAHHRPNR